MLSFLTLPIEIRHHIYEELSHDATREAGFNDYSCIEPWLPMTLLLVNKQISREALDFTFKGGTLRTTLSKLTGSPSREDNWARLGRKTLAVMAAHSHIRFITKLCLDVVVVPAQIILRGPLVSHGRKYYYLLRVECWKSFSRLIRSMHGLQSVLLNVQCYSRRCMPWPADLTMSFPSRQTKLSCPYLGEQICYLGGMVKSFASHPMNVDVHFGSFEPGESDRLLLSNAEIASRMRQDKAMLYYRFEYVWTQIEPVNPDGVRIINESEHAELFSRDLEKEYSSFAGQTVIFEA